ncbi:hypothetical protein WJX84_000094 [Apatococcus fuscideae]|uniref:Uncharacterized protein n=1 Tax=Apatococcus fuscideae TaxID=2026836 RepID=A0AAW1SJ47_9CHLO
MPISEQMSALQAAFTRHKQLVDDLCSKTGLLGSESITRMKLGRTAVAATSSSGPSKPSSMPRQITGVKRKLDGPALLIAAALNGEGL